MINRDSARRLGIAALMQLNSFHHGGMVRNLQDIKSGNVSFFWRLPPGASDEDSRALYKAQQKQAGKFFSAYGSAQSALQSLIESSDVASLRKTSGKMHAWLGKVGLGTAGFRDDTVWNALNLIEYAIAHKGKLPGSGEAGTDKLAGFIAGFFPQAAQKAAGVSGLKASAYDTGGGGDSSSSGSSSGRAGSSGGTVIQVYGDVYGYDDFKGKVAAANLSNALQGSTL